MRAAVAVCILFGASSYTQAQQVADTGFQPAIATPAFERGKGPLVLIDEAHANFHTADGRYLPFAELLRRDGYVVAGSKQAFDSRSLRDAKILVIANATAADRPGGARPMASAFTDQEIEAVRKWVSEGGSLLLIVDHMPAPAAAAKLGAAFGARWSNGYALDPDRKGEPLVFRRTDNSLRDHPLVRGRSAQEQIDRVATFTGSAFQLPGGEALLVLGPQISSFEPAAAGQFTPETKRVPVGGWYQGAVASHGKGRIALFGEAAMFTAQLAGPARQPMGMNAPLASQNAQFLLNVLHWLSRR